MLLLVPHFPAPTNNSNKANKEELGRRCRESYLCPAPHFHYHIFLSILFLAVISSVDCNASLLIAFGCIGEGNWRRRLCRLCVSQSVCFVLSFSIVTILHSILLHSLTHYLCRRKNQSFQWQLFSLFYLSVFSRILLRPPTHSADCSALQPFICDPQLCVRKKSVKKFIFVNFILYIFLSSVCLWS